MIIKYLKFLCLLLCVFAFHSITAQTQLSKSVLSNGSVAANNNIRLNATLGQAFIGVQSSGSTTLNAGFFAPAKAALLMPCDSIVTNLNDAGPGSLREALSCAVSGDTITFTLSGTISLTSGVMNIPPGVVINGDGVNITIDAQGNSRIFSIENRNADSVSIRNIYFLNGAANNEDGGAILANGSVSFINCDFDNCTGTNGGAIKHTNGDLDLVNCAFVGNEAQNSGGAIRSDSSNLTMVNSIFYDNFATQFDGAITAVASNLIVFYSTFIENGTSGSNGGISNQDGNIEIYNSIIFGNNSTDNVELTSASVNAVGTITAQNLILGDTTGSSLIFGVNNVIPNDPQISDAANNDFSIGNNSPAQGNGDPALIPQDIFDADADGDFTELINFDFDRIERGLGGTTYDMGALEKEQGFLKVINTNESGIGSLGQAIENTNLNTTLNRIEFAIPGDGPHEISLTQRLPQVSGEDVVIDGASQAGYADGRPAISINGNDSVVCLLIESNNCSVSGLRFINGDAFRAVSVGAFSNITFSFNTLLTNQGQDHIAFFGTRNSSVFNNRIGIDTNDLVLNTNVTGLALSDCENMDVQFNTITGSGQGIALGVFGTDNSFLANNSIGITPDNQVNGGDVGVFVAGASGNRVEDNSIANFRLGIFTTEDAQENIFTENNFFCNSLGIIQQFNTQRDLAAPLLTIAIPGELSGTAQPNAIIEIFQELDCGIPLGCQGVYQASVTADLNGDWTYADAQITEGLAYTATQTIGDNTSPFANCLTAILPSVCDIQATASADTLTCTVQQVTLMGNSSIDSATYNWTGPNAFSSTVQNPIVNEGGLYSLIVADSACADTMDLLVVIDTLAPELSGNTTLAIDCLNPTTQLVVNSNPAGLSYDWSGPNGFSSGEASPTVSAGGQYELIATAPNGCQSSYLVEVVEDSTTAPIAGFTVNINGLTVSFNNSSSGDATNFQWDFGNGNASTEFEPATSYLSGGLKTVQLIASNLCGADTIDLAFELIELSSSIRFEVDLLTEGAPGDTVQVPVRVFDFQDVISFQFSMFHTDATVARFVGVSGFNLPDLGLNNVNIFSDSLLTVVWFSSMGVTPPDSTIIFNIDMEIISQEAACTRVEFGNIPTESEVGLLVGDDILQSPFVQKGGELCVKPAANIFGQVFREDGRPLADVAIDISSSQGTAITDENGFYEFLELPTPQSYTLSPSRFTNPLEGVTSIDLALIQRHIIALQALDSPYKIIAADVDTSRTVTAIDLATIQRLILGINTTFPGNQSPWTFVDATYNFQNPTNPLDEAFPKTITINDFREDTMADFIGMKLGDVNNSGQNFVGEEQLGVLFQEEVSNGIHTIIVKAPNPQQLAAFQFDINFDPAQMTFLDIEPGTLPGINDGNFNLNKLKDGLIPMLWFDPTGNQEGFELKEGEVLFKIHFAVDQTQESLSKRIWTNDNSLPAIAYTSDGAPLKVRNFYQEEGQVIADQIRLEPFRPNPFTERTEVGFYLPEAAVVSFEIYDALGRQIDQKEQFYEAGHHRFFINAQQLNDAGWYFLKMNTTGYQANKRFILQR